MNSKEKSHLEVKVQEEYLLVNKEQVNSETTLNDVLRNQRHLTGTKYMCREGGCGVCVVSIKYRHPVTGKETTLAVNSCLLSIFQCSNQWKINTIEGLVSSDGKLHPIQDTLVKFNGTQCGFCTPGMVMNMHALYEKGNVKMEEIEKSFGGNLCRCTGYRPILSAFKSLATDASEEIIGKIPDIEDLPRCTAREFVQGGEDEISCNRINCSFMFDLGEKKKWFNLQTILATDASEEIIGKISDIEDLPRCTAKEFVQGGENEICSNRVNSSFMFNLGEKERWYNLQTILEILEVMKTHKNLKIKIVGGNTAKGVYYSMAQADVYIDIFLVKELRSFKLNTNSLILGANMTLTEIIDVFREASKNNPNQFKYLSTFADHFELVAHVPVRNVGTIAGNLSIKHAHNEFVSDIFVLLEAVGAILTITDINQKETTAKPSEYLKINMNQKLITSIKLPALDKDVYKFESYKIMPRSQNAHAIVNAAFLLNMKDNKVKSAMIVYGGINPDFIHAKNSEKYLADKNIFTNSAMQGLFKALSDEIKPDYVLPDPKPEFRKQLAISLAYKFILSIAPNISTRNDLGGKKLIRNISKGSQEYETNKSLYPLSEPVHKIESYAQVSGEAEFVMDNPDRPNQLYAAFVEAKAPPHSIIKLINTKEALALPGVVAFIGIDDIPGLNSITPKSTSLAEDEELFCSKVVKFFFQPVGVIVAKDQITAEKGAELVKITYEASSNEPIITIRDLISKDPSRIKVQAEIPRKKSGTDIKYTLKGTYDANWQFHFTLENQSCSVIPKENGEYDVIAATQWKYVAQAAAASCVGVDINKINLRVRRCGGGFGGKLTRANIPVCAAIVAAAKLKKPVKLWMPLIQNMNICGKRHPVAADYTVKLNEKGLIQSLDVSVWTDFGITTNDTLAIQSGISTMINTYNNETFQVKAMSTNSDNHSATYQRAPAILEGCGIIESILEHASYATNLDPLEVRLANLNTEKHPLLKKFIEELRTWAEIDKRSYEIKTFNKENRWRKRGLSASIFVFDLDFFLNANVIISVYRGDGSVAVSHGGIEVGQGINTKVAQVVGYKLGVPIGKVSIKPSDVLTSANNKPTTASQTSDSHCIAASLACDKLLTRLQPIREDLKTKLKRDPNWEELIKAAYNANVDLISRCAHSPDEAQNYKIYGVGAVEIEYDVLTGNHLVLRADILEDTGTSMSPYIDIGQTEGAFIMGLGFWTSEKIIQDKTGEMKTNRTWNFKVPGAQDIPVDFRVKFPKNNNPVSPFNTKATGEPPICLAFAAPLAFRRIIKEVREEMKQAVDDSWIPIDGPNSVEFNYMACLPDYKNYTL